MINRLYVHNFRCLENFDLRFNEDSSTLLIGRNGSGKSTVAAVLEIFQSICRGSNRVRELIRIKDVSRGRTSAPIRLEIETTIKGNVYAYKLVFELPEGFKELRVKEESLTANGKSAFDRDQAMVSLPEVSELNRSAASFPIDWHNLALPLVRDREHKDPIAIFREWMARMLILRPIPELILGESTEETLLPKRNLTNFSAWFSGLIASEPTAYSLIEQSIKSVFPDFVKVSNPLIAKDARSLSVTFRESNEDLSVDFEDLSDGEKCLFIWATVVAAQATYGPLCCFWDEPDNFLSIGEIGHLGVDLRKSAKNGGQFITTSHNPEFVRRFSDENTLLLFRKSHLEPTQVTRLEDIDYKGDLIENLILGDLEQ